MATHRMCDRCLRLVPVGDGRLALTDLGPFVLADDESALIKAVASADLCRMCRDEFRAWWRPPKTRSAKAKRTKARRT